jgi:hypothetical protein
VHLQLLRCVRAAVQPSLQVQVQLEQVQGLLHWQALQ